METATQPIQLSIESNTRYMYGKRKMENLISYNSFNAGMAGSIPYLCLNHITIFCPTART